MEKEPVYFDGRFQVGQTETFEETSESFLVTDEMRKNISGNPYFFGTNK